MDAAGNVKPSKARSSERIDKVAALVRRALRLDGPGAARGDVRVDLRDGCVEDAHLSSGTTRIAGGRDARACHGPGMDPRSYCDVIVARWERFSGKVAERLDAAERTPA